MIVAETTRDLEQSGMGRTVQAKIKASRKLFSFFSDGVYSNKPVAIARELVANAVDSHVMAGRPNVPVEVQLPTALDPTFIVRDFGTGMSEDFLFNNYLVYAEGSTKDGSNEAIGGFGIGKAAVFSYTDQFSLVSVQNGVRGVYSVFLGEDGIPAISQIAVQVTDDHDGVEISFPVENKDIQMFHDAAQEALRYFHPLPTVANGTLTAPDYTHQGNGWALRPSAGELGVILGGVRYPVTAASLSHTLRNDSKYKALLGYGIDLTMPIGSVSIALSREALQYNDTTNAGIKAGLDNIFDDVKKTFSTMFDMEPTLWAASKKLYKEIGGNTGYGQNARQQLLGANAVYKGKKLLTTFDVSKLVGAKIWDIPVLRSYGRQSSLKSPTWNTFDEIRYMVPGSTEAIIVDDMSHSPKNKTMIRVRNYVETELTRGTSSYMIRLNDQALMNDVKLVPDKAKLLQILDNLGIDAADVKWTSDLPEPPTVAKGPKVVNVRPKVRMFSYDGSGHKYAHGDITNLTPGVGKSVKEIKYIDQPSTGTMVVMDNFDLPKGFRDKMKTGLIKWEDVYFINKTDEPKLTAFKKFDDVFQPLLDAALAALPKDVNERLALRDDDDFANPFSRIRKIYNVMSLWTYLDDRQKATPFGQMVGYYDKYVKPALDVEKFRPFLTPKLPTGLDPAAIKAEYNKDQPDVDLMLDIMPLNGGYYDKLTRKHVELLLRII